MKKILITALLCVTSSLSAQTYYNNPEERQRILNTPSDEEVINMQKVAKQDCRDACARLKAYREQRNNPKDSGYNQQRINQLAQDLYDLGGTPSGVALNTVPTVPSDIEADRAIVADLEGKNAHAQARRRFIDDTANQRWQRKGTGLDPTIKKGNYNSSRNDTGPIDGALGGGQKSHERYATSEQSILQTAITVTRTSPPRRDQVFAVPQKPTLPKVRITRPVIVSVPKTQEDSTISTDNNPKPQLAIPPVTTPRVTRSWKVNQ